MSPIHKKLHVKTGSKWLLFNAPANYLPMIEPLPDHVSVSKHPKGVYDGIQLFTKNYTELLSLLDSILPLLKPDTIFWITYPKKSSGMKSDLEMLGAWDALTDLGLRIVTSISVDETWTALRFKPIVLTKISEGRNERIKSNEYSEYIDVDNKQITLPEEMKKVLQQTPQALMFYQQLSHSNKKEYVLWILTARQEKTRLERLEKMVDKMLKGKKNPVEK